MSNLRLFCNSLAQNINCKSRVRNDSVFFTDQLGEVLSTISHPLDETPLDAVRGLIKLKGFHPSASTSGVRRSDAATSDKGKQICFMLMPRT